MNLISTTLKLNVLEITQCIGTFYLCIIDGNQLYKMAKADIRRIVEKQDYEGIQRELNPGRVKLIKSYLKTESASFPNTIILNLDSNYIVNSDDKSIEVMVTENTFSIIDGQHRLSGFQDGNILNFQLPVAIFIDLDISNQAELFGTINSEQVAVNASLKIDLENYSKVNTPKKMVSQLAYTFNSDKDSPWQGKIKITGKKDDNSPEGIIAQKSFVVPILNYIYDSKDEYEIRDLLKKGSDLTNYDYNREKYIFWEFFLNNNMEFLYKILLNYYKTLRELFYDDWGNNASIINKTTGYNAIMKLFKDVFLYCENQKDFSEGIMKKVLNPLSSLNGTLTSSAYGASGESSSTGLYKVMYNLIKDHL